MIGFSIAGRPVNLLEWRFDAETNRGDRTLTGKVPKDVTWAEQDAPVVAWRGSDDAAWSGQVTADPRLSNGLWSIRAHGLTDAYLEPQSDPMLYRVDGTEGWVNNEDDPHNYAVHEELDAEVRPASLFFRHRNGETVNTGQGRGWLYWAEGALITGYSFRQTADMTGTDNKWRVSSATGPDGTLTTINDHGTTNGTATVSGTVSPPEDMLVISYRRSGGNFTAGSTFFGRLDRIKIYGRTTDDTFSLSDVVEDVGTNAGLDVSGVQANSTGALPLYWTEGHPELLDYLSELADWRWLVTHNGLEFGPYERTWTCFEDDTDGFGDMVNERRHNTVVLPWRDAQGRRRDTTSTASDDPFPGRVVALRMDELEDPQPDNTVALAVSQARADYEVTLRVTDTLQLHRARMNGAPRSPYDVKAGDLLLLPELHPLPAQRIEAVTYEPDDRVTVELGYPFNLAREMAEARTLRKPKRFKKKKGKK